MPNVTKKHFQPKEGCTQDNQCHYAECRVSSNVMLNVMLSVILQSVVMLSVMAPNEVLPI